MDEIMYAVDRDFMVVAYKKHEQEDILKSGKYIYFGFYEKKDALRWAWFKYKESKNEKL